MSETDTYHSGEIAVQERTGQRSIAVRRSAGIVARLNDAAGAFLDRQGVAAVGAEAPDGSLWASLWCGGPGFLRTREEGDRVQFVAEFDGTLPDDVVNPITRSGAPLGMLIMDFEARRRLRVNGTIERLDEDGFDLRIQEAFGNCNKYIQRRHRSDIYPGGESEPVENGRALDDQRRRFIMQTDTLFVASIHPVRGLDVSHRGGNPRFVHVEHDGTLKIPDYPGNSMFQTLGNFEVDSRAGLALIDFDRRRVLSLTGSASASFGSEDKNHPSAGTARYWLFTPERWVEYSLPPTILWTLVESSPFNPAVTQP